LKVEREGEEKRLHRGRRGHGVHREEKRNPRAQSGVTVPQGAQRKAKRKDYTEGTEFTEKSRKGEPQS
jgi:hypothetical protein